MCLPLTPDESDKGWWGGVLEQFEVQGFHLWWWRWWALTGKFPWTAADGCTLLHSANWNSFLLHPWLSIMSSLGSEMFWFILRTIFRENCSQKRGRGIVKINPLPLFIFLRWFIPFRFFFPITPNLLSCDKIYYFWKWKWTGLEILSLLYLFYKWGNIHFWRDG